MDISHNRPQESPPHVNMYRPLEENATDDMGAPPCGVAKVVIILPLIASQIFILPFSLPVAF